MTKQDTRLNIRPTQPHIHPQNLHDNMTRPTLRVYKTCFNKKLQIDAKMLEPFLSFEDHDYKT